jgi:hypothetical protein
VLVLAVLAFPRRPLAPAGSAASEQPERRDQAAVVAPSRPPVPPAPALSAAPVALSAVVVPRATREPSKNAPLTNSGTNRIAEVSRSAAPVAHVAAIANAPGNEGSETKPARPESMPAAPARAAVSTDTAGVASVTITGCLEVTVGQDEFRLTDTDGADAPKSRSWRSGFLRKRSAPVALVEAADRQALHAQVGKRIAATGLLTGGELKVNSLRVVGSCN